jgi:steroid 5-alpha reductase family enzyme
VPLPSLLGYALAIVSVLYLLLWLRTIAARRMTVIDPFWGLGFAVMGFALLRMVDEAGPRTYLMLGMITVWALRYAAHIWFRSWGHDEASLYYPYAEQRAKYGKHFWWVSLFTIVVPQMLGHVVIGLPLLLVLHDPGPQLGWLDALGFGVWLCGASCEAIADLQMLRFKSDPHNAGKLLDTGLWRYSRHPNYFGDALAFWGLALVGLASPLGAWGLLGPALLTLMLTKFSGVTMVEARSKIGQKPAYAEYVRRTSAFVPWPPKR